MDAMFDGWFGGLGAKLMLAGAATEGRYSVVEHQLMPRALGSPLHRHAREDEWSLVLEGQVAAMLGDQVIVAGPGEVIAKPRGQWHAFWNAGEARARLVETIAPAGFEAYFAELLALGGPEAAGPGDLCRLAARYALEVDPTSVAWLADRHGLALHPEAAPEGHALPELMHE